MSSKQLKFDSEPCMICEHPRALHRPQCFSHGYIEDKPCRKRCTGFKRDNLKWLEKEYRKHANSSKVQTLQAQ